MFVDFLLAMKYPNFESFLGVSFAFTQKCSNFWGTFLLLRFGLTIFPEYTNWTPQQRPNHKSIQKSEVGEFIGWDQKYHSVYHQALFFKCTQAAEIGSRTEVQVFCTLDNGQAS